MGETRPDETAEAEQAARRVGGLPVRFRAGETIFRPGDSARGWIVVESGRVRVGLTADTGREVVLYRLGAGDSCLLTTSALLRQETMLAEAIAETDVAARLVPVAAFERLLAEDAAFRRAVLRNYAERVGELVVVIQDVLFHALPGAEEGLNPPQRAFAVLSRPVIRSRCGSPVACGWAPNRSYRRCARRQRIRRRHGF